MSLPVSCDVIVVGGGAAGTAAAIGGIECITPSPTYNGAQDTFCPDWQWSVGDWRRKVGHEGNQ